MIRVAPKIVDLDRIIRMAQFRAYRQAGSIALGIIILGIILTFVIKKVLKWQTRSK